MLFRSKAGRSYADLIVDGHKTLESRNGDSLRPYVGKRVSIVRTGEGKAKAIGEVTIGEPMVVNSKQFRELEHKHLVPKGSAYDISTPTKHLYPLYDPERYESERDVGHGIVSRKVMHKADGGLIPSLDVMRLAIGGAPDQSPFYSAADQAAQQLQRAKGTGAEFLTELTKAKGVKPAEVEHRGLGEIGKLPKMTKEQFMAEMGKRPKAEVKQIIKTLDDEAYDKALEEAIVYQAEAYASSVSGDPQEQKQIMKERIEEIKNNPEYLDAIKDDLFPWGNEMAPQFDRSDLKLPGGKKYREILFQLP